MVLASYLIRHAPLRPSPFILRLSKLSITSGALSGTYYGPNADSVGGVFELNTDISKAIGVFGASQEE